MSPRYHVAITTIFPPSTAIHGFATRPDCQLYVAGDRKTPAHWARDGVHYLSAAAQENSPFTLARDLPWNHYCRKMLAYLAAIQAGAEVIVDTDDDNVPKPDWAVPAFEGSYLTAESSVGYLNVYRAFSDLSIWPRGFPLELLRHPATHSAPEIEAPSRVGIWQGLADGDPDVDAIYRLTVGEECTFAERPPLVLAPGTVCPFNSQNTAVRRELFALLYLPAKVTFRFTDILRGLVAQPIMAAAGYALGFTSATVVQERNPHNYLRDFESEIPCYLHVARVVEVTRAAVQASATVEENLLAAYRALVAEGIVPPEELPLLQAWLADLASLQPR